MTVKIRHRLYQLAEHYKLSPAQTRELMQEARLDDAPEGLESGLWKIVAVLSAALTGFGLIMWIAANWEALSRTSHFILLQGFIVLMCLGAWLKASARVPMGLLALLGIGALFAYYGQTYQTGADAWQLFVLWTLLTLPLCLGIRSDVLWIPWALLALTSLSLWVYAQTGYTWTRLEQRDFMIHMQGMLLCTLILIFLAPQLGAWTGAGRWSQRTAVLLVCVLLLSLALRAVISHEVEPQYYMVACWFLAASFIFAVQPFYDLVNSCLLILSFDLVAIMGLYRFIFHIIERHSIIAVEFLLLGGGVLSTLLVALSVFAIMKMYRFHAKNLTT